MSVSPVSSPFDPYAAPPVSRTGQEAARKGPQEEPRARQGHHDPGGAPAETPSGGTERAPGSDSVGTLVDVRV
jgi:hypothetical protein